jgi:ElaB/YqjD/DUF883 family membrane-anchored ribosome-binding protein
MGLEDLIRFVRRSGALVLLTTVVAGGVAAAVASAQPKAVETSITFAVNRVNREPTPDYQYDGYYALQAADLFAQTVVSWLSTPAVVRDIYAEADIPVNARSLADYSGRFRTKKYSAQNITVRFTEADESTARTVATAVVATLQERTASLNETSDEKSIFALEASDPVVSIQRPPVGTAATIGALAGLLLGILAGAMREAAARVRNANRA